MNKAILIGRLTKDPELRTTKSGVNQAKFTIAVNRKVTNEDGTREADFINCIAWQGLADTIYKYFKKGKEIAIEGRIQTGSYEGTDGTMRYTTDIIVENVTFLGSKEQKTKEDIVENKETKTDPFEDIGDIVELDDDDLPF